MLRGGGWVGQGVGVCLPLRVWDWFEKINFVEGEYKLHIFKLFNLVVSMGSKYRGIQIYINLSKFNIFYLRNWIEEW